MEGLIILAALLLAFPVIAIVALVKAIGARAQVRVRGRTGVSTLQSDRQRSWRLCRAMLDSALGCSIFSTLKKGDTWTTLELKINYVRAMTKDSGPVRAEGRVIHRGRSVATSEGDLKDCAGKLYAHASTTCMIFPA